MALREAMTSAALLFEVIDEVEATAAAAAESADAATDVVDAVAEEALDAAEEAALRSAHAAIEAVEPGWEEEESEAVFVRGVGLCDQTERQAVRSDAAVAWEKAQCFSKLRRGGKTGQDG